METSKTNENKLKWGAVSALLVLAFILILNNILIWLTADFLEGLVITQKYLISIIMLQITIFLVVIYFKTIKGVTWRELGIRVKRGGKILSSGIFGGAALFTLVISAGMAMELILPMEPYLQPFAKVVLAASDYRDLIILLLIGAVLVPICEELYFRGILYPAFKEKWGPILGMIVSGAIFSLLHVDILRFIPLLLGGIGLAYIYEKSGSLFACILAHGFWNGAMILILYYSADYFAGF